MDVSYSSDEENLNVESSDDLDSEVESGQTVSAVDSSASWVNVSRCEFKSS